MGDPLAVYGWYDNNAIRQLDTAAYERGVAAGRRQAADALRRAADSTRETYVRDAFKLAARIAEGAPAEPAPLADRLGDTWASPVTATGFDTEEDTDDR